MDVERLLAEEETGWRELHDVIVRMNDEQLQRSGLTPQGWAAKDAMFHIGAWMADFADQLERMRMGTFEERVDTVSDIDRQNREWFELSQTLDLVTVKAGFASARARMVHEFRSLTEVTASAWGWFEESGPLHYRKHVEDLAAWAERG